MNPYRFAVAGWTFEDDFTGTDDWLEADTKIGVNTTTDVLDVDTRNDSTNDACSYDLGASVSDSAWLLRFRANFSTLTVNGTFGVGLSDLPYTTSDSTAQDFIGIRIDMNGSNMRIGARDVEGAAVNLWGVAGENSVTGAIATATNYYYEVKRTSTTAYTVSQYTDSAFTTLLNGNATSAGVCTDTTVGLRYIKIMNVSDQTFSGTIVGVIDDVQFLDGSSIPP